MNDYSVETPWNIVNSYFEGNPLDRLVRHQIESFNHFMTVQAPKTIDMFNPIRIRSKQDYDVSSKQYALEIYLTLDNFKTYRPQIHENNGAIKIMFPQEARLRNFTYAVATTVDVNVRYVVRSGEDLATKHVHYNTIPDVHLGKLPIMVNSSNCVLTQHKYLDRKKVGECAHDAGGYLIINGSEKTVLCQERAAENRVYCHNVSKNTTKYTWSAEIKSVPNYKCISPKQISVWVSSKNNGFGYPIYVQLPRMKPQQPVPLFVLFRAIGVITDKAICERILLDIDSEMNSELLQNLKASIIDADHIRTRDDAVRQLMNYVAYAPIDVAAADAESGFLKKLEFTVSEVLRNDLFPHCSSAVEKEYFLGYMVKQVLLAQSTSVATDRDSYANKRVDAIGTLLNNLFRNYLNKVVKDIEIQVIHEIEKGSWRSTEDYKSIITHSNIYKHIKSTTIENGIRRALSTGDFGINQGTSTKVGVAQVLNRLTYPSTISHLRRVSTPTDKSGKHILPRKLSPSSWGFICPFETPEGQSIGIVKNISYMAVLTIASNIVPILDYVLPHIDLLNSDNRLSNVELSSRVKVFINGSWMGVVENGIQLYHQLKSMKHQGIINIYTSVIFDISNKEIRVCNDAGRLTRPLLRVLDGKLVFDSNMERHLINKTASWNDLLTSSRFGQSSIEYIDPEEQQFALIATTVDDLKHPNISYTHCEIHPSTILGVIASCIPFCDHNQSPRNTYQSAMGKQSIGIYSTMFNLRMDKTAYVLNYPSRPLVDTRLMTMLKLHKIPSGYNAVVAIMTHTGYNQEDSVLINEGSINRGLFQVTVYHTEKDEDKQKINGSEEIRCRPDPHTTRGMKLFSNYDKVDSDGLVPENTILYDRDIVIAKKLPIKEHRNNHMQVIKYEDQSKSYRTTEESYIDKNYINKNGDGYNFAKVRVRTTRTPVIGDKFSCYSPDHDILTDKGWVKFPELTYAHKVATLVGGNQLRYDVPIKIMSYDFDGDLYRVKTDSVDLTVTPNHRMYVSDTQESNFQVLKAEDIYGKAKMYKNDVTHGLTGVSNIFELPGYGVLPSLRLDMTAWLEFFGMWVVEGRVDDDFGCAFSTYNRQSVIRRLASTCEALHFSTRTYDTHYAYHPDSDVANVWYVDDRRLVNYFKSLRVMDKFLPDWCFTLSAKQSRLLINGMMLVGGYYHHDQCASFRYDTLSATVANGLQRLCLHAGVSCSITSNRGARAGVDANMCSGTRYELFDSALAVIYKLTLTTIHDKKTNPIVNAGSQQDSWVKYAGKVYCCTVPSGIVYVRNSCSRIAVWSGNSRHGQKGTAGNIIPEKDMPFMENGIRPDIIINPHAIPSRMTIGQLKETSLGKVLASLGLFGDGTAFGDLDKSVVSKKLLECGYSSNGEEVMYNAITGEQMECSVFIGPVFYQRLKHMVQDKQHSRSGGPNVNLTHQPAEGRCRSGGLRFGEMERDCMVSHGAARFTQGRMMDASDGYQVYVCKSCGMIAAYNNAVHVHNCRMCDNRTDFAFVKIPYSCKLLFQELQAMNISPRVITDSNIHET